MFDVAPTELLLVAVVALVVIGPKDLPRAMRVVGHWVGRARGMARHFRSGIDEMIRQSELQEMEKKWREENERIMREFPTLSDPIALPGESASPAGDEIAPAVPAIAPPPEAPLETSPDLANWQAAAAADAAAAEPPLASVPPARPSIVSPAASEPAEEQLSLLPPEPSSPAGPDKPAKP